MEAISRLVKRKIRKEQISPPTDFLHVKHVGPAVGNELNAIFMGQQGALPVAGVSMKNFGRPLPAAPSASPPYATLDPVYENIGPAYDNVVRELRDALPLGEETASGRVVIHVERTASGHLRPPSLDSAEIPPPVPPHAPPPIPPHGSRPTAPPSGDLAEPQAPGLSGRADRSLIHACGRAERNRSGRQPPWLELLHARPRPDLSRDRGCVPLMAASGVGRASHSIRTAVRSEPAR